MNRTTPYIQTISQIFPSIIQNEKIKRYHVPFLIIPSSLQSVRTYLIFYQPSATLMIIKERGEVFAIEYGVPFLETSARTDENIDQAFTILAESILNKVLDVPNKNEDVIILPKENSKCTICCTIN